MFFISRTQRWTHKAWDFHLHSGFTIFFIISSARTLARLSVTSWFPRESLRHSHFAVMWLVGWTDRKQTTNTIEKGMLFGCEQPFLWGERCVTSQKTAAKETTETTNALWVKTCKKPRMHSDKVYPSTVLFCIKAIVPSHPDRVLFLSNRRGHRR